MQNPSRNPFLFMLLYSVHLKFLLLSLLLHIAPCVLIFYLPVFANNTINAESYLNISIIHNEMAGQKNLPEKNFAEQQKGQSSPEPPQKNITKKIAAKKLYNTKKMAKTDAKTETRTNEGSSIAENGQKNASPKNGGGIIKAVYKPKPEYPELAIKRSQEGTAKIQCKVDRTGKVAEALLLQSSGYKLLDNAALTAIKNWKFETQKTDEPFAAIIVPVEFKLK